MYGLLKWIHLLALVVWIGAVVFFSFVVAPSVFKVFASADAGRAVAAMFPTYYRIGYGCGLVLLATCLVFSVRGASRGWWGVASAVSAAMLIATLYAGMVVQPRATELRPLIHDTVTPDTTKEEFSRLHRQAVILNSIVLLGGLGVTAISATTLRP